MLVQTTAILLQLATNAAVHCDKLEFFLFLLQHIALVADCISITAV